MKMMTKSKLRKIIISRGKASASDAQIRKAVLEVMKMREAGLIKATKSRKFPPIRIFGLDDNLARR
jgi:hypothetical protein